MIPKTMKTMLEYLKEIEIEVPDGEVSGTWFAEHHLPMVVRCTDCGMTMVLFSAMIDDEGLLYCKDCAPYFEIDEVEIDSEKIEEDYVWHYIKSEEPHYSDVACFLAVMQLWTQLNLNMEIISKALEIYPLFPDWDYMKYFTEYHADHAEDIIYGKITFEDLKKNFAFMMAGMYIEEYFE